MSPFLYINPITTRLKTADKDVGNVSATFSLEDPMDSLRFEVPGVPVPKARAKIH